VSAWMGTLRQVFERCGELGVRTPWGRSSKGAPGGGILLAVAVITLEMGRFWVTHEGRVARPGRC
jgi:hypothetical protein